MVLSEPQRRMIVGGGAKTVDNHAGVPMLLQRRKRSYCKRDSGLSDDHAVQTNNGIAFLFAIVQLHAFLLSPEYCVEMTRDSNFPRAEGDGKCCSVLALAVNLRKQTHLVRQSEVDGYGSFNGRGTTTYQIRFVAPPAHGIDSGL